MYIAFGSRSLQFASLSSLNVSPLGSEGHVHQCLGGVEAREDRDLEDELDYVLLLWESDRFHKFA